MSKKGKNNWNTIILFGIGGLALNALKQYFELKNEEKEKFDWREWGNWGLTGAAIGTGVVFAGIVIDQIRLSLVEDPRGKESSYLRDVLKSHRHKDNGLEAVMKLKKRELNEAITDEFSGVIYRPMDHGSGGKATAIPGKSDIDVLLPYRKSSFTTLAEMYDAVHTFLTNYAHDDNDIIKIRKQGKSLGVFYSINGETQKIDVVPGREMNNFAEDGELALFVKGSFWSDSTYIKTNIQKQREDLVNRPTLRGTIKLLKIWKDKFDIPIPSIAFERLAVEAFKKHKYELPSSLFERLMMTMTYIYRYGGSKNLKDPGNSNNIILSKSSGQKLAASVELMIENIKEDRRYLAYYFPK